jgi:hypothetical protein
MGNGRPGMGISGFQATESEVRIEGLHWYRIPGTSGIEMALTQGIVAVRGGVLAVAPEITMNPDEVRDETDTPLIVGVRGGGVRPFVVQFFEVYEFLDAAAYLREEMLAR